MIRLLVVDCDLRMRDVMTLVLEEEPDMVLAGFASTAEEALAQLDQSDLVLVSANLPGGGACEVIAALARSPVRVNVVAIDVPDTRAATNDYLVAGATDCVLEEDSVSELFARVRAAVSAGAQAS